MTEIPEGCVNVRNAGSIIDRPLLNTKWMLPNSTIGQEQANWSLRVKIKYC